MDEFFIDKKTGLRILLSKRPSGSSGSNAQQQDQTFKQDHGFKQGRRADDELIRRKSGFINFWDLGQIKDGSSWVDLDWSITPTPDPDIHAVAGRQLPLSYDDYKSLTDLIFTVPTDNWETQYRKLGYEDAERYGLDVLRLTDSLVAPIARDGSRYDSNGNPVTDNSAVWTPKGLKSPLGPTDPFVFNSFGAFADWGRFDAFDGTSLQPRFKYTLLPDKDATEVPFPGIAKNANVFLMPHVATLEARSNDTALVHSDHLLARYQILKRGFWLDKNFSTIDYPLFSRPYIGSTILEPDILTFTDADKIAFIDSIRVGANEFTDTSGYLGNGTAFPIYTDNINFAVNAYGDSSGLPEPFRPNGTFVGAIRQGGKLYYCWVADIGGDLFLDGAPRIMNLTGLY